MEETKEIVIQPVVKLGSLEFQDPKVMIARVSVYASQLAKIIKRRGLYVIIQKKAYVFCEGWTTLGALLGVVPVEEYCRRVGDNEGYEAKVNLIRTSDGSVIGSASAETLFTEAKWAGRENHALRSMAITRATSKAFRLSFSWIMKLAGYEALPAEEAEQNWDEGKQAQHDIAEEKKSEIEQLMQAQVDAGADAKNTLFCQWPESHNGHYIMLRGYKEVVAKVAGRFNSDMKAKWNEDKMGFLVSSGRLELVKEICEMLGVKFKEIGHNPLDKAEAVHA